MERIATADVARIPWLGLAAISLVTVVVQVLLTLAAVIPYVGGLFQFLQPILAFFLFVGIGLLTGSSTEKVPSRQRRPVLLFLIAAASLCFAGPYVVGYYTYPVKIARSVASNPNLNLTYSQAFDAMKSSLRQETGSDGVVAYALYTERLQLSANSFGKFVSSEFEDVDDFGGIISAIINTVLHAIPLLVKLLLCDTLRWVAEAGIIGLVFWYLLALALTYVGFRTA